MATRLDTDGRSDGQSKLVAQPVLPVWVTSELIQYTIEVWQPFYTDDLTTDDAIAILLSVGRLFDVLSRS